MHGRRVTWVSGPVCTGHGIQSHKPTSLGTVTEMASAAFSAYTNTYMDASHLLMSVVGIGAGAGAGAGAGVVVVGPGVPVSVVVGAFK